MVHLDDAKTPLQSSLVPRSSYHAHMRKGMRNANANVDILYKCTIDEIRLRVISDLQAVHEYS